jgi:hypothetical protein
MKDADLVSWRDRLVNEAQLKPEQPIIGMAIDLLNRAIEKIARLRGATS